jgi:hypothetical protein
MLGRRAMIGLMRRGPLVAVMGLALFALPLALLGCGGGGKVTVTVTAPSTNATTTKPSARVPSSARARRATIKEVYRESDNFGNTRRGLRGIRWNVSCIGLTRTLYRCDWKAHVSHFMQWSGRSKVRFYSRATDTKVYQVSSVGLS